MKSVLIAGFAATGLLFAGAANASLELAQKNNCMACHAVDKKVVGPAYKEVAAKYKGDKKAEAAIIEKLKEGKGHPMKVAASDAELKTMVQQVLAQK